MINTLITADVNRDPDKRSRGNRFGDKLIYSGVVTEEQLLQAVEVQSRTNAFLGQILIDLGFASAQVIGPLLAQTIHVRYVDILAESPSPEAVALVPEH